MYRGEEPAGGGVPCTFAILGNRDYRFGKCSWSSLGELLQCILHTTMTVTNGEGNAYLGYYASRFVLVDVELQGICAAAFNQEVESTLSHFWHLTCGRDERCPKSNPLAQGIQPLTCSNNHDLCITGLVEFLVNADPRILMAENWNIEQYRTGTDTRPQCLCRI